MQESLPTKVRAVKAARLLVQQFGFGGLNLKRVATAIGIKQPSLYDHFESKDNLGELLVDDYYEDFKNWADSVADQHPRDRIIALFDLFHKINSESDKVCPAAAMAGEFNLLPERMQIRLRKNFGEQMEWLRQTIQSGQQGSTMRNDRSAQDLAESIFSLGLGVQMVSRLTGKLELINQIKTQVLEVLAPV